MFKYENLHRLHESVGNPDSKGANLSWMPYKDLKILNKKNTSKCLFGVMVAQITTPYYL